MTDGDDDVLEGVTLRKHANVYYDGDVTSRSVETADGVEMTLGIMRPGEYTFDTDEREEIEILAGEVTVALDNERTRYGPGDVFTVPPDTTFELTVHSLVDYSCTYG